MEKVVNALNRMANSNAVMNVFLLGCFGAMSVRSMGTQRQIEALEAEKDSLALANKAMKSAIWDWKKQLYAEAEAAEEAFSKGSKAAATGVISLSKLKAIYGEVTKVPSTVPAGGNPNTADGKSSASSKIIV
ncbi:OLC1v1015246C1 [Oldenlandia corymbosa var. corymbosa]|uniref:OLC1v1015246C1 n=1 Tax=Oldenlandia corymbosa var. corymbosa TaxID=529605 RepID=A0AAV1E372_OLDCO|nr:OLC1v1015246C1 [Oldenlandia corymbosa var. corymbosa]